MSSRFGVAAAQLADLLATGHATSAVVAFAFALFAILAGWINFSWFASAFDTDVVDLSLIPTFVAIAVLGALELLLPVVAQGRAGGTPWHPHHIADRYGGFAIIALGEGIVGTVASSRSALGGSSGLDWDVDAVLVVVAGIGLTFAMWWTYFLTPYGDLLRLRPSRGYLFGCGHILSRIARRVVADGRASCRGSRGRPLATTRDGATAGRRAARYRY
ncbi:low temperature requirement A protein (LtrA) [Antricoccus suffuscus]|uniref:Low temperature requirement A protein (LtrA) n=1 Tax=Antricoccus suffuscus TaxID=1629062 RepID=A0A2T1A2M9_9ACTN|nr:low temperature requirement protein A [Antricoccus suffuscus]PRZ42843.1 low temperature requirement A protein (LtrA) [Antricoccus suffuscus]